MDLINSKDDYIKIKVVGTVVKKGEFKFRLDGSNSQTFVVRINGYRPQDVEIEGKFQSARLVQKLHIGAVVEATVFLDSFEGRNGIRVKLDLWDVKVLQESPEFLAKKAKAEQFSRNERYAIVDVSAGPDAESYPIQYTDHLNTDSNDGVMCTTEYYGSKIAFKWVPEGVYFDGNTLTYVTISCGYWISVNSISNMQWGLVTGAKISSEWKYSVSQKVKVSYSDVRGNSLGSTWPASSDVDEDSFIGILRRKTGLTSMDLPTEGQWTKAFQDKIIQRFRYMGRPEDTFAMCLDWDSDELPPENVTDPFGGVSGDMRVAMLDAGDHFERTAVSPCDAYKNVGFRVVFS